ncbi:AMP-binding protein [Bacteroidota bacterium]
MNNEIEILKFSSSEMPHRFTDWSKNVLISPSLGWKKDIARTILLWFNTNDFIVIETSGSTGTPKKIKLLKKHMISSAYLTINKFHLKEDQTTLLCLPAKYIAGMMMVVRAIIAKMNLVICPPSVDPIEFFKYSMKIDFAPMLPMQLYNISNNKKSLTYLQENFKTVLLGGGSVSEKLKKHIQKLSVNVYESYGMTETITHIAVKKLNTKNKQLNFKPFQGINIGKDKRNCLVIDLQKLYNKTIITNDIVKIQSDNGFMILGRIDNVINTGGLKIIPEKLENKIEDIYNNNFIISSIPDDELGEKIVLIIERPGLNQQEKDAVHTKLKNTLAKKEIPKDIFTLNKFIYTKNNKINRLETRKKLIEK